LHECCHTYASFLMPAGYALKQLMEYMGHADLQMVQRYTKLLPQPTSMTRPIASTPTSRGGAGDPRDERQVGHNARSKAVRSGS
jgi:hypothetical protein